MRVRRDSKRELVAALRGRYQRAGRVEKGRMLDELVVVTGYHRKYAVGLLRASPGPQAANHGGGRPRFYGSAVVAALSVAAEATGGICGKRLVAALPDLVPALELEGALQLEPGVRAALLRIRAATIDRRLGLLRAAAKPRGLGTTKPGSILKRQVPIRTYTPWNDQAPGFVEVDLVAHCGTTTAGTYICTLTLVDIATGWTECTAVATKTQEAVFAGLQRLRAALPFPLLGIDSDNGSEFLNERLVRYCHREGLTFTRCRAYHKNDQAHVEERNGAVVRQTIGYDRYERAAAAVQLNRVYERLRVQVNGVLPAMKLVGKERVGARVRRKYDVPTTPLRRALALGVVAVAAQERFARELAAEGPLGRRRQLDAALEQLWTLRVGPL
jgi:Integrase core domain